MESNDSNLVKVGVEATKILDQIKALFLDKVIKIKDEDESVYWKIKDTISGADIDKAEYLLMDVSRLYREAGLKNNNPYYRKMSRMVFYIRLDYMPSTVEEILEKIDSDLRKNGDI